MGQHIFPSLKVKTLLSVAVPAILIAALSVYALGFRPTPTYEARVLFGKPLAAYDDLYPIQFDPSGALVLDKQRFEKAIDYLIENPSPHAIADLIYLGNSNHLTFALSDTARKKYIALSNLPDYAAVKEADLQKDSLLQVYKDIVNGIGQTFAGTPIEIVLHDTRNPLRSIVAVQNPISGRRLGDPNTNFGIQLIKNYSQSVRGQAFVSYGLTFRDGRTIKSTTIPLFHNTYGLIGFICINIDISKMDGRDPVAVERFIDSFRAVTENQSIDEMIQNSRRKQ